MATKLPPGITEWTPHPTTGKPRWLVRWRDPSGKPRKKVEDRLTDAKRLLAEKTADRHRGTYVDDRAGRELVETFADRWAAARDWKASSRKAWPKRRRRMVWALGDGARLCDVDQLALLAAKAKLGQRYSPSVVTGTMHDLCAVMRSAVAAGAIGRDPTIDVDAAPKRRQGDADGVTPEQVPSKSEALAILAGAPDRWRAAIALGLAGLRIGEMLGMRHDRLALDRREVTVDAQAIEVGGPVRLGSVKNDRPRTIEVSPVVAMELRRHLRAGHAGRWTDTDGETHEMLFVRPDGALWRQGRFAEVALAPALEAAELKPGRFTFHAFRHFCASQLLAAGAALPIVAGYLGDHQQTVMRTYSHWLPDDRGVPAAILDRVLAPDAAAPSARHGSGTDGR